MLTRELRTVMGRGKGAFSLLDLVWAHLQPTLSPRPPPQVIVRCPPSSACRSLVSAQGSHEGGLGRGAGQML